MATTDTVKQMLVYGVTMTIRVFDCVPPYKSICLIVFDCILQVFDGLKLKGLSFSC